VNGHHREGRRPPRDLHRRVLAAGWTYTTTGKGHPRYHPPPGTRDPRNPELLLAPITVALTSSDRRGLTNTLADFRRAGLNLKETT
jgi:hypothetical protein